MNHNLADEQTLSRSSATAATLGEREIRSWFIAVVAGYLEVPQAEVDTTVPFAELGLTSAQGVQIAKELSRNLGVHVPPEAVFDHPTISLMAKFLARAVEPASGKTTDVSSAPNVGDAPTLIEDVDDLLRLISDEVGVNDYPPSERANRKK